VAKFLRAQFNPTDFRKWMRDATYIRALVVLEKDRLPRNCALEYKDEVSKVIASQAFHKPLAPLSVKYRDWKAAHGFPTSIGILKRDLLQSLIVLKESVRAYGAYYGGVDPSASDQGGKNWYLQGASKKIITYAIWLEEGRGPTKTGGAQPARPIFKDTREFYAKGPWLRKNEVVINLMKRMWG